MTDDFEVAVEEGATIVRVGGRSSASARTPTTGPTSTPIGPSRPAAEVPEAGPFAVGW